MQITLLTPPVRMEELHPQFAARKNWFWELIIGERGLISGKKPVSGQQPPFGILFLSAQLKKHGYKANFLDGYFNSYDDILKTLKTTEPTCVGIGSMTYNWTKTKLLASKIKELDPDIKVIVGGKHPTIWQQKCLEESSDIDFVVMGEAEETIIELVKAMENKLDYNRVKGIIYRDENGAIVSTGPRNPVKDLDLLPFMDRDLFPPNTYRPTPFFYQRLPHTAIFASRGCPYPCTFCHSEKNVRFRSPENVVEEIQFVSKKYGIREISFYDETFTLKPRYADALCEQILTKGLDISWTANARADKVDLDILKKMKRAGCWRLLFGIESGVPKNLKTLKKSQNLEKIMVGVQKTSAVGMESYGMFMFGIPGETYQEALETVSFACKLPLDYAHFVNITPFPGTELYEQVKHEPGLKDLDKLTNTKIGYVPQSMTEDELRHLLTISFKKFYFRPRFILSRFGKIRSFNDFKRYIQGFLALATSREIN